MRTLLSIESDKFTRFHGSALQQSLQARGSQSVDPVFETPCLKLAGHVPINSSTRANSGYRAKMTEPAATAVPIAKLIDDDCRKLLSNRASLPSMPDVATRIRQELQNSNWSVGSIARIIKQDPGTTTHLLKISNSALYSGATKIGDVEQAIVRIGIDSTRNLVTAHTLRSMFVTPSPMLAALMRRAWQRSARLASICAVLSRQVSKISPERAMLAGLLQDIGALPILNVLKRHHEQLRNEVPVVRALERFAAPVGTILLTHWGFEEDMIEVARSRRDWSRDPEPKADLADLVLIARLHAGAVWRDDGEHPRLDQVPAFSKFSLGELGEDSSLLLLHDQEQAIEDVLGVLGVKS
jgi:HD-like signal output (HDOD) protein